MINKDLRPRVGVGIMVFKGGSVLLGKRLGSHGAGEWCFPGGHLEFGESLKKGALRELKEECGVKIKNIKFLSVSNTIGYGKHYLTIGFVSEFKSGEPKLLEPEKYQKWQWFALNDLPKPIFKDTKTMIKAYQTGKKYFDA